VTLRGGLSNHPGAREPLTVVLEHGSLRSLKRTETASTVLDLDALRSVRSTGALPAPVEGRRGFFRQWQAAVRSRGPLLEREGLLQRSRDGSPEQALEVRNGAERTVEGKMARGERIPTTLRDLERIHGKDAEPARAEPGRTYRGAVVGYAVEDDGQSYVALDTGQELTAVPTDRRDLEVGHVVRARAEASACRGTGY
jgi:hypothetical protein